MEEAKLLAEQNLLFLAPFAKCVCIEEVISSPKLSSKLLSGLNTAADAAINGSSGLTDSVGKQPLPVSLHADHLCSAWTRS